MNHFRKQILFVCDSIILIAVSAFFSWFSLRYNLSDAVGRSFQLLQNFLLLYGCTVLFQFIFRTYDSLWRYAESALPTEFIGAECSFTEDGTRFR